jgi:hypothetical protein
VPDAIRLPGPRLRRRILLVARVLIVLAALITLVAVQWLTAFTLSLFLIVGQAFVVAGALLALGVAITDLFRRRGVAQVRFAAGETIFEQGDRGDLVYMIVAGQVEALRVDENGEERLLATMGPGEYFGEMALISEAPRTATVRAKSAVEAVSMGRADFTTLYAYLPGLRQRVETLMQKRAANTGRKRP